MTELAAPQTQVSPPPQPDEAPEHDFGVKARKQWRMVLSRFLRHRLAVISLLLVIAIYVVSYFPVQIGGFDYEELSTNFSASPSGEHLFGTNEIGRDIFAQTMRGVQVSIHVSLVVAALATAIGALVGAIQGWFGGKVDGFMGRVVDLFLVIPALPVLLVLGARVRSSGGSSVYVIALFLALLLWPPLARVIRSEVLSLREREFIEAARALGANSVRIIGRHLIPNVMSSIIVYASLTVATAIIFEAALAFLGLGIQPPEISLGKLVDEGYQASNNRWWLFYLPGSVLIFLLLCVNFVGDGLRDAFDPGRRRE